MVREIVPTEITREMQEIIMETVELQEIIRQIMENRIRNQNTSLI